MKKIRLAINGYGRIGRHILRAHFEYKKYPNIDIVAINSLGDPSSIVLLTRFDSVHGHFAHDVSWCGDALMVDDQRIAFFSERDPRNLPWGDCGIDIVLECTGHFVSRPLAAAHLEAGARRVLISAPAGDAVDATVVYGVNHRIIQGEHQIVSNASCTTNCLAPLLLPLHQHFSIRSGLMTTVHAYTNDQVLNDSSHRDLRRGRAAALSMIPTKTGAAMAVGRVIPALKGKLDGYSVRVPTPNVSLLDLTFTTEIPTGVEAVIDCLKSAAENELSSVLTCTEDPLVSVDFNHNPASCVVDVPLIRVVGDCTKVVAWYDNEWGFCNRMLDTAHYWVGLSSIS